MGMEQKKCPVCKKCRPFDHDTDRGLHHKRGKEPRWTKIGDNWVCNHCIKAGRAQVS